MKPRECYTSFGKPKTTFVSKADAEERAAKLKALKGVKAYKCGSCPGWHLGHPAVRRAT